MLRILLAVVFTAFISSAALAERRVALVLGADRYATLRPLANAVNDARAVEDALAALGFEVFFESNRNLVRMRGALSDFRDEAAGADVALIFFAGHGVEIGGENRLLPTDADPSSLERLKDTSLPLEELRETVEAAADVGLIVIDACRNDPFGLASPDAGRGATALAPEVMAEAKPGLGRVGRSENVLFAFSAAPGQTAADGNGRNSPFTAALTKYLPTDGLEIRSVLTLVQQEVYDLSGGTQLPYVESGLPALFFAAAQGDLPERERLLLAMADVTPALRDEVERVAADHQMPLAPLYGALVGNRLGDLPAEERGAKLAEAARSFVETREKLRTFASSDEAVTRLRAEAEQALSLGAFSEATARLDEAIAVDGQAAEAVGAVFVERTVSKAGSLAARAGVERAGLRHAAAIASLEEAAAQHVAVAALDIPDAARRARVWVLADIGDLHVLTGDTARALDAYRRMQDAAELRMARAPQEPDAERDLSVSHSKIGDVRLAQGDLGGALDAYRASLAIRESLVARDPGNAAWQRILSASHGKIGDVRTSQGDLTGALNAYQAGLAITQSLTARDPGNTDWQRDLSISHSRIGDVRAAQGDLAGAFDAYQVALAISQSLMARDPGNTLWQRDLSINHSRVGDVRGKQGDLAGASDAYQASLAISQSLTARDPGNTEWQRDLSAGHERIGNVRVARGDQTGALDAYQASLAIRQSLAARDPGNTLWQRDLSIGHERIGDLRLARKDQTGALDAYQASLAIRQSLAAGDPDNTLWQRDLSISHERIGKLRVAGGDLTGALNAYQASLAIRHSLAARDPGNAEWQRDLFISHFRIGDVRVAQGDLPGAIDAYQAGHAISESLSAQDPSNAGWQRDLMFSHVRLAQAGGDARAHLGKALEIALEMEKKGILAPSDAPIPGLLRAELAKLEPSLTAE